MEEIRGFELSARYRSISIEVINVKDTFDLKMS